VAIFENTENMLFLVLEHPAKKLVADKSVWWFQWTGTQDGVSHWWRLP